MFQSVILRSRFSCINTFTNLHLGQICCPCPEFHYLNFPHHHLECLWLRYPPCRRRILVLRCSGWAGPEEDGRSERTNPWNWQVFGKYVRGYYLCPRSEVTGLLITSTHLTGKYLYQDSLWCLLYIIGKYSSTGSILVRGSARSSFSAPLYNKRVILFLPQNMKQKHSW